MSEPAGRSGVAQCCSADVSALMLAASSEASPYQDLTISKHQLRLWAAGQVCPTNLNAAAQDTVPSGLWSTGRTPAALRSQ